MGHVLADPIVDSFDFVPRQLLVGNRFLGGRHDLRMTALDERARAHADSKIAIQPLGNRVDRRVGGRGHGQTRHLASHQCACFLAGAQPRNLHDDLFDRSAAGNRAIVDLRVRWGKVLIDDLYLLLGPFGRHGGRGHDVDQRALGLYVDADLDAVRGLQSDRGWLDVDGRLKLSERRGGRGRQHQSGEQASHGVELQQGCLASVRE